MKIERPLLEYEQWLLHFAKSFDIDNIHYREALLNSPYSKETNYEIVNRK